MRIALLSNSAKVGGGNRSLLLLAEGLQSAHVDVTVICPGDGDMADLTRAAGVRCEIVALEQPELTRPWSSGRTVLRYRRLLKRLGSDIVDANGLDSYRAVALAARSLGLGRICHFRYPLGDRTIRWMLRAIPAPAKVIFNSHALLAECGDSFSPTVKPADRVVVHNAVDLERFTPRALDTESRPRIGIVANFVPVKGHTDFLKMARVLTDQGVEAVYVLAGADIFGNGLLEQSRLQATALGLADRVEFTGHVRDVPSLLRSLDVVVSSSHVEPFGRTILEAMACQVPVVATRVGGVPEIVEDAVTGMLVPPRDPHALANAVSRLAADPSLRRQMGRLGRMRAVEHFSVSGHVSRILGLYEDIIRGGAAA